MTALGKILVFFNLLFSLGVGALVIMDYSARTYYAKAVDDLDKGITILQSSRNAYKDEADRLNKSQKDLEEALRTRAGKVIALQDTDKPSDVFLKALTKAQEDLQAKAISLEKAQKEAKDSKDKVEEHRSALTAAQEENKRREKEVAQTRRALDNQLKENERLLVDMKSARDDSVKARVAERAALDRADQMFEDLKEAKDKLRQANTASRTVAGRRPTGDVDGVVRQIDQASGLLTISVGKDAGLEKDHELQVFRLDRTNPLYLGSIRLVTVGRDYSVGQLTKPARQPIRVNDQVSTSILPGS